MLRRIAKGKIVAPKEGRVFSIDVPIPCAGSWRDGIAAGAPDTVPGAKEWEAEESFRPSKPLVDNARAILMWPGKGKMMSPMSAVAWGRAFGLEETHPLEVLALSAAYPHLYWGLKLKGVGLVPTAFGLYHRSLHICGVRQSLKRQVRQAVLRPAQAVLHDETVFVFRA